MKRNVFIIMSVSVFVSFLTQSLTTASAVEPAWVNATIEYSTPDSAERAYSRCDRSEVSIVNFQGSMQGMTSTSLACVYKAKDFEIAKFLDFPFTYKWGIKTSDMDAYVHIDNFSPATKLYLSRSSNRLVYVGYAPGGLFETTLSTIEDLRESLNVVSTDGLFNPIEYRIAESKVTHWFDYEQPSVPDIKQYLPVYSVAYSQNGRYVLAWVNNAGHVKLDLDMKTATLISSMKGNPSTSPFTPDNMYNPVSGAITNDGRFAFVNNGPKLIDSVDCGLVLTEANILNSALFEQSTIDCPYYEYEIGTLVGYAGYSDNYEWINGEDILRFRYYNFYPQTDDVRVIQITKDVVKVGKLKYLAIGDSYSSGEGDIARQADDSSFYLSGTDALGGCHVSSRSYPFILAQLNNLTSDRTRNVACAGARMANDYHGQSSDYLGQSGQLKDKTESERAEAREASLRDFSPGILKQIDFVKENKPKIVTLTGGGNDVGFGPLLNECASSVTSTCSYALSGDEMAAMLGSSIKQQYESMQNVITAIKNASPETTVYVVGYPKFLASESLACFGDVGALDYLERTAVNQGLEYLNDVIQAAAVSKGAHYINTEESLVGGRMCEGSEYVTNVVSAALAGDLAQAFHPNAAGHEKMALAINGDSSFGLDTSNPSADTSVGVPNIPEYFGADESVRAERQDSIVNKYLSVRSKAIFSIQKGMLRAGSRASISIHSKAKNLGTHTAASDGSLSVSRHLPSDIPTGYHTVLVKGIDPLGAPLWLYQFVYVDGSEPDTDKDGIPNGVDKCQFRAQIFDESAQQFICAGKPVRL